MAYSFPGRSAVMLVVSNLLGVFVGATLALLLSSSQTNPFQLALQQQQQEQQHWANAVGHGEEGSSASVGCAERCCSELAGKGRVEVPEAVPIQTTFGGAAAEQQGQLSEADAARQGDDIVPEGLSESGVGRSSSSLTGNSDGPGRSSSHLGDPMQCGPDGLRPLVWGQSGEWSYASCDLCGLSGEQVADVLAQPHDCQTQIWDGLKWRTPRNMSVLKRRETPVCVITCAPEIPCRGHVSNASVATPQSGSQSQAEVQPPQTPEGGPRCLLAAWVRPGTSDGIVLGQVFFGAARSGMWLLGIPPPDKLPIKYILDAGANIGLASVYFAMLYPGARIVTLEPSAANFNVLLRNVAHLPNVMPLERGLWSRPTRLYLTQSTISPALPEFGYQVFDTRKQIPKTSKILGELQSVSVDFLVKSLALPKFDLVKMDIEGAEGEVFRDGVNVNFLAHSSVAILEVHNNKWPGARKVVMAAFKKYPRWSTMHLSGEHICYIAN